MENVVLTIHLILALLLIGVVLLQRNEGGALLSGGGAMTARGAANALTRLTWIFAIAFFITSIALTVVASQKAKGGSVIDLLPGASAPATTTTMPAGDLLPPAPAPAPAQSPAAGDAPVSPTAPVTPTAPEATAPATSAPATTAPTISAPAPASN